MTGGENAGVPPPPARPRRVPVFATLLVVAAVATMVALGIWQLQRKGEKEALIARYAANRALPPVAFPNIPTDQALLFRHTTAFCLSVTGWRVEGAGKAGWRYLARCRTGAEGPGFMADMGTSPNPRANPAWKGGAVSGIIVPAPGHASWIAGLLAPAPKTLMIVAAAPAPGLAASATPDPQSIPNNHLVYAIQWFFFASAAGVIYALALRQRLAGRAEPPPGA
ncbi:SURF1 family protein [Sphingomonas sp.]|uniref:SURF1 family protein n=1 Tax=Sphingomonas sp. TaxID=28214 RepID=UPI001E13F0A0|nr:SURF1 family protein [Sphingomonas sp.]MBX9797431.1 SURF1 family protein [Sphingomonas sp.]